jgi:hypothetical protein
MANYDHPNLSIHGRLVQDPMTPEERATRKPDDLPAPMYEIGVEIEGHFVPIHRMRSAAGLFADINRLRAAQAAEPVEPEASPGSE